MIFGGNTWDWILIFLILMLAFGSGMKDSDGEQVIPKELMFRTYGLLVILLLLFNLPKILGLIF